MRRLARDDRGTVFVEFLIVAMLFLMMVLSILQLALLASAKLVVLQSARSAARAAIVVLDDEPLVYGGEPRQRAPLYSRRHAEIQRAAEYTLLAAASAGPVSDTGASLAALYTPRTTVLLPAGLPLVTFPSHPSGVFGRNDEITARVVVHYPCVIPLGRAFICGGPVRRIWAEATLTNQGAPYW